MRRCSVMVSRELPAIINSRLRLLCAVSYMKCPRAYTRTYSASVSKSSKAKSPSDALLQWAERGTEESDLQFRAIEERRQAFSVALQTLSAMTHAGEVSTKSIVDSSAKYTNWDRMTESANLEMDSNPGFWSKLSVLTRKQHYSDSSVSSELQALFDDPDNACQRTLHAYTLAIGHCVRSNNFKLLRHFAVHAKEHGIVFDTPLCNTMLGIFLQDRSLPSWTTALRVFASLRIRADTSTWNQLLTLSDHPQKTIVLEHMQSLNVPQDTVTLGIMLPLHHRPTLTAVSLISTTDTFRGWTPSLGDVLIGDLIKKRDLFSAVALLDVETFSYSLDGINQVLSGLRRVSKGKYKWPRLVQQTCQAMDRRAIDPDARTFLLLYQLGKVFSSVGYRDMVFRTAEEAGLVTSRLWQAKRDQDKIQAERKSRVTQQPREWDWQDFLTRKIPTIKADER